MGGMGGTNLADPSAALLATCGGDAVKLFDLTVDSGDPCALSYVPTSGSHVNSVKWNHTSKLFLVDSALIYQFLRATNCFDSGISYSSFDASRAAFKLCFIWRKWFFGAEIARK